MGTTGTIILVIVLCAFSFGWYLMQQKKTASVTKNFNVINQKENTSIYFKELLNGKFSFLKDEMKNAPVDAFSEGRIPTTTGDKAKALATDMAKSAAWRLVGVKARYTREDAVCYFVLSGDELHFLTYFEDKIESHIIFNNDQVRSATISQIENSKTQKKFGAGDHNEYELTFTLKGEPTALILKDYITEVVGQGIPNAMSTEYNKDLVKQNLIGLHFKQVLGEKYHHLKIGL
ncbi:hypothetical protein JBL43_11335 [Aureibaculum sp. A20]|uniref:DUF4230 domain-containing protein n=1 Tax=Aureibaculum flavum TaxID=2795986 RepID=A0ABS0WS77_9FLAO|nr:hypothetical protein [Aureibaculum flavum]MBJ2174833.1 hypothetical protein [Aureibaculum flavum]